MSGTLSDPAAQLAAVGLPAGSIGPVSSMSSAAPALYGQPQMTQAQLAAAAKQLPGGLYSPALAGQGQPTVSPGVLSQLAGIYGSGDPSQIPTDDLKQFAGTGANQLQSLPAWFTTAPQGGNN